MWGSFPYLFHNELGVAQKGILREAGTANGLWRYCGLREGIGGSIDVEGKDLCQPT